MKSATTNPAHATDIARAQGVAMGLRIARDELENMRREEETDE